MTDGTSLTPVTYNATPETLIDSAYSTSSDDQAPIKRVADPPNDENSDIQDSDQHEEENPPVAEEEEEYAPPKGIMEYDISNMYPEIGILVEKKRAELDYHDPDVIRAIWLENKTQVLQTWKERNVKIYRKDQKPKFEPSPNQTTQLRAKLRLKKEEQKRKEEKLVQEMIAGSKIVPKFDPIQLATNVTTEFRYKFNRNNPPIPSSYVKHYTKYKRPPFKLETNTKNCRLD